MDRIRRVAASEWFFLSIITLFIAETLWVICTLAYPGIFDESWHYQIIREHALSWLPILTSQSHDTYHLGNITYDPSFLYHYLLSFPYRLMDAIGAPQDHIVIALRIINLAMVTAALLLFRHIFFMMNAGRTTSHLTILLFILIPVVPFLAAQINNDNLVIVWVALSLLFLIKWRQSIQSSTPSVPYFLLAASSALLGAMSQYVFLPILLFVGLVLAWDLFRLLTIKKHRPASVQLPLNALGITSLLIMAISTILFISSYGINLVRYHTPVPSCERALTVEQCRQYYTFERNYTAERDNPPINANPVKFTAGWFYRLYTTSFYTVLNGSKGPLQVPPFPLPTVAAGVLLIVGAVLFILNRRKLIAQYPHIILVLGSALFFVAILWLHNYQDFLHFKAKVGINGRYLLLVTPFIMIAGAVALRESLLKHPKVLIVALAITLFCFTQGGGISNYIVASYTAWWWTWAQAPAATAKAILSPLVLRFPLFW